MDKSIKRKTLVLTLVIFALTLTLIFPLFLSCISEPPEQDERFYDKYGLDELLDLISDRYIGEYDIDELLEVARRAIVDSLDDDWSFYMTAEEFETYLESSDNRYHGIGVEVKLEEELGGIRVINVYRNSGAQNGGIIAGDLITAVDGVAIRGYTILDVRNALKRELDSTVIITVLRSDGNYYDLTIVYSIIFVDPVHYEMLDGNIGYISLRNFEAGAADSFINAVDTLIEQGAVAFIYDVRSNNGGKVVEMTAILDYLLPEGEIFIAVSRTGEEQITRSDEFFIDLPAVVLVNSFSYSGAEYFTAILSEYEYAQTVGEQTTGKNRMQTTLRLSTGAAVHLSTGEYLTKNRVSLFDQGGYTPDFLIPLTDEQAISFAMGELEYDLDPQLQKALSLLKN